ncbi:hypothetical protein HMPREF1545_04297 [Oscillibacter sp. KLE 1728]|nr:hypothetical protein HMPREF1545_04297 [Oscillibacter sp. KLE 1728]ERK56767.1 hypothetical protein HMPREF1546_04101 [Oscillibacter sp. KLE 1745]
MGRWSIPLRLLLLPPPDRRPPHAHFASGLHIILCGAFCRKTDFSLFALFFMWNSAYVSAIIVTVSSIWEVSAP